MIRPSTLILILVILIPQIARADIFRYYPDATLRLGRGFNPLDVTEVKADCYTYSLEVPVDGINLSSVSSDVRFTIEQVTDSRELHTLLNTSASIAGHYEMFSADASSSSSLQLDKLSNSTSWVLRASTDFGRFSAKDIDLNAMAKALLRSDPIALIQKCGTEVVAQVTRGVSIAAVFTLQNTEQNRRENSEEIFNASVGGEMWGLSADTTTSSSLAETIKRGDLKLNIVGSGGQGAAGFSDLVKDLKDAKTVAAVKGVLATYVRKFDPRNAAITEYQTASIETFAPQLRLPDFTLYNRIIQEYYFALSQNLGWVSRLADYLAGSGDFNEANRLAIQNAYLEVRARTFDIAKAGRSCRDQYEKVVARLASTPNSRRSGSLKQSNLVVDANRQLTSDLANALSNARYDEVLHRSSQGELRNKLIQQDADTVCLFNTSWYNFAKFSALPRYPFELPTIWTDPLGQAPSNFLMVKVSGEAIEVAKLVNPKTGSDILVLSQDGPAFRGLYDLSITPDVKPLDLIVLTKSGRRFSFRAWN